MNRAYNITEFAFHPFHASYMAERLVAAIEDPDSVYGSKDIVNKRMDNFWTIGKSTYKDGYDIRNKEEVKVSNDLLLSHFPEFYKFQILFFENIFREPVTYMQGMPLPGFHCFKGCEIFTEPLARPHVDVPFNKYSWGKDVNENKIFTHVIPIKIPSEAGMFVWDLTARDMHERGPETVVMEARSTKPSGFINYREDLACVHSGKRVHTIKPFNKDQYGQWRITLQSHAVFLDGKWQLYW